MEDYYYVLEEIGRQEILFIRIDRFIKNKEKLCKLLNIFIYLYIDKNYCIYIEVDMELCVEFLINLQEVSMLLSLFMCVMSIRGVFLGSS